MNIEKVKIEELKLDKNNPRKISKDKMDKLVQSIKDFPEMLEARPIVVDDEGVVVGGNMRLKACKIAGLKEVSVIRWIDLSEERRKEFVIKDNVGFGDWDWDILSDDWDTELLEKWGLDWGGKANDEEDEVEGEMILNKPIDFESNYIVLKFDKDIDWIQALSIFDLESGYNLGGNGKAFTKGLGRVIDGVGAINKIKESGYEG